MKKSARNANNQRFLKYFNNTYFNNCSGKTVCIISANWTFFADFFLWKAVSRSFRTFLYILEHCEIYKDLCIKIPTNLDVSFQEMHLREEGRYNSYFLYNEIFVEESCFVMTFFHEKNTQLKFSNQNLFFQMRRKKNM